MSSITYVFLFLEVGVGSGSKAEPESTDHFLGIQTSVNKELTVTSLKLFRNKSSVIKLKVPLMQNN